MLDEARIAEIEERHKKARKGPYRMWTPNAVIDSNGQMVAAVPVVDERAFFANSWTDVRDLLEEVRALRKKYRIGLEEEAAKVSAMPKKAAKAT